MRRIAKTKKQLISVTATIYYQGATMGLCFCDEIKNGEHPFYFAQRKALELTKGRLVDAIGYDKITVNGKEV